MNKDDKAKESKDAWDMAWSLATDVIEVVDDDEPHQYELLLENTTLH